MKYRGITQRTAEWIGMAASVAGGYVAVAGPRIIRTPYADVRRLLDEWHSTRVHSAGESEELDRIGRYQLRGGDYIGVADHEPDRCTHLILCVPDDAGLASEGYALPADFIAHIRPRLEAAGYVVG